MSAVSYKDLKAETYNGVFTSSFGNETLEAVLENDNGVVGGLLSFRGKEHHLAAVTKREGGLFGIFSHVGEGYYGGFMVYPVFVEDRLHSYQGSLKLTTNSGVNVSGGFKLTRLYEQEVSA